MESALHKRDTVGVQDFVLLEDFTSEDAFVDNLRKRFKEKLIYTYIGPVLVLVNPYQNFDIYNERVMETYRNVNFYELPPHIYAISDVAYRKMRSEFRDQCVLISGESGAGKTEASKQILQYIAASSGHSQHLNQVKDRLLQSNPILEGFGNAKTNRNDNSSRFGKYMDVQFDFKGIPIGGVILNYLLEKSRVVHQSQGERNFHIFYQIVRGGSDELLDTLHLQKDVGIYHYLNQGSSLSADTLDDVSDFRALRQALDVCDFTQQLQTDLFSVVASVLHLGNLEFTEDNGVVDIPNKQHMEAVTKLLGCNLDELMKALTHRSIMAEKNRVHTPFSKEQAVYARDAFAKGVYERLFSWLVRQINTSLESKSRDSNKCVLGILDIYGFEIFQHNSFEQFCINYCNEKLQQLFITLTLKSEQEEYLSEGIEWEPVTYFNNAIICDLVEGRPLGIIALLDEECLRPGNTSDTTFLQKLNSTLGGHAHLLSHDTATAKVKKTINRDQEFRLIHYAGEVTYNVRGFLDKNNDLLFRDIKEVLSKTTNQITRECFPEQELHSKKRPDTAGTQFKTSLAQLMDILMSKEPAYIRCIKPNDEKKAGVFVDKLVIHQVKYLGLMENLRVRRAGFAYRREYPQFLHRYKSLCPATWPHYRGDPRDGVHTLVKHLNYQPDDYRLGKSKIFIRLPKVLFATEDALQQRKHTLATQIQAKYKCHAQRKQYLHMRKCAILIESVWRMALAKRKRQQRREAVDAVRKFVKGFITRNGEPNAENKFFVRQTRYNYLMRLRLQLPQSVLDKSWPESPHRVRETSMLLKEMHMKNLVRHYCKKMSSERKHLFEEKVLAEELFRNKKESYRSSIPEFFKSTRLQDTAVLNGIQRSDVKYGSAVTKYDRNGYKSRPRTLLLTSQSLYLVNPKDGKIRDQVPYTRLTGISVSSYSDSLMVIHVDTEQNHVKGDVILSSEHLIETIVKIVMTTNNNNLVTLETTSITHKSKKGKPGIVDFNSGPKPGISKSKNGHLLVTYPVHL